VARVLEAGRREREAGVQEVARLRSELAQEVAAMQQVHNAQRSRVELDIGGTRYVTSVSTLRSRPGSMLDALFSGRHAVIEEEDGSVFIDRDGSAFGHVLAYLRDGVVAAGCEDDARLLGRLKRDFDYYCIELVEERTMVLAVGGFDPSDNNAVSTMERYDRQQDSWTAAASMRQARSLFGSCMIAGELYVTGGLTTTQLSSKLATVERYNPSSNAWSSVAAMPQARFGHGTCEIGGSMYVLGGNLQHTWKYDAMTDTWSEVAPMPALRCTTAACAIASDIYVIGGNTQLGSIVPTADVYKYSVDSNSWSTVSPMPTTRAFHGACVLGGMIYVAGGRDAARVRLSSVLRYDPSSDTWSTVAAMSQARSSPAVFEFDGCVYAAGGYDASGANLSTVEKYEPAFDRWSTVRSMGSTRYAFKAIALTVEENVFEAMMRRALQ
jgi:N-acetylneuraminic acid mutarotase